MSCTFQVILLKCQLTFNWHLNLSKSWATQSKSSFNKRFQLFFMQWFFYSVICLVKQFEWSYGLYDIKLTSIFFFKRNIAAPICQLWLFCLPSNIQSDKKDLLRGSYYVYTRTYIFKWLMQGSTFLCMPNART